MQIGFLGLGNMGRNLALNMQEHGHQVHSWNRSQPNRELASKAGLFNIRETVPEVVNSFPAEERRVIWSMVSAGSPVDEVFFTGSDNLFSILRTGDIVIDGANSHYAETMRRAEQFAQKGIILIDGGVSGGVEGARRGACMMIGGDKAAFDYLETLFKDICQEGGYGYFGNSGAGHYVKMVHNAIEYAMMQSIAEGVNLLSSSPYASDMDLAKAVEVWNHGSIIQSRLIGFLSQALQQSGDLQSFAPEIGSLGTGEWAVAEAIRLAVPVPNIANSVFSRYDSRGSDQLLHRVVQAMRSVFGAHSSGERPSST